MKLNINDFISTDDIRVYLHKPFNLNGKTVATNGHCVLFSPMDNAFADNETLETVKDGALKIQNFISQAEFIQLPSITMPEIFPCIMCNATGLCTSTVCEECNGDRLVYFENQYNSYAIECATCDGEGYISMPGTGETCPACEGTKKRFQLGSTVSVEGVKLDPALLEKISDVENIEISGDKARTMLFFRAGEFYGALMGIM